MSTIAPLKNKKTFITIYKYFHKYYNIKEAKGVLKMPEKKKSSFLSKVIGLLIGLAVFAALGVVLAVYMETKEFNITMDIIKMVANTENFYTYVGGSCAIFVFILFIKWTNVNSSTPKQITDPQYDVKSQ